MHAGTWQTHGFDLPASVFGAAHVVFMHDGDELGEMQMPLIGLTCQFEPRAMPT